MFVVIDKGIKLREMGNSGVPVYRKSGDFQIYSPRNFAKAQFSIIFAAHWPRSSIE
jgi:hypothetical protein